jgi:hypothetical protein
VAAVPFASKSASLEYLEKQERRDMPAAACNKAVCRLALTVVFPHYYRWL